MKRVISLLFCLLLAVSLTACGKSKFMYIEPAKLTEDEENTAELVGSDALNLIYDFRLDDTVETMQLSVYELVDGAWEHAFYNGTGQFIDSKGRIALGFDDISYGMRIARQGEHNGGADGYEREKEPDAAHMAKATAVLGQRTEFVYDQEIPLIIQAQTSQKGSASVFRSFCVDHFFEPEYFEGYGYDHVYAVTILFSQKKVSELVGCS